MQNRFIQYPKDNQAYSGFSLTEVRNYFLVTLLLFLDDSPFFLIGGKQTFWLIIFSLLLIANKARSKTLNHKIVFVLLSVLVLIVLQSILFNQSVRPATIYQPIWLFYTPFLVFTLMGLKYFKYLFNIIFFVAVYTSIIYITYTLYPPFNKVLTAAFEVVFPYSNAEWPNTILIFTSPVPSGFLFMRNSGIFHEPGAYSIYLMLAIVINTYHTGKPLHIKSIFLMVVMLSTFSTTGYLILFLFLSFVLSKIKIPTFIKPLIIIPFAYFILIIYQQSSFLEQKVDTQLKTQTDLIKTEEVGQRGRFYAFGMALKSVANAPLTGRGILALSSNERESVFAGGYGFAGLFARFGLIFSFFYLWYFYKGFLTMSKFNRQTKYFGILAFIIINLGLLTQVFFFHTPFIYFFIIGLFMQTQSIQHTKQTKSLQSN